MGWLSSPRLMEDGIYADLNLLKSDPNSSKIVEMAERNPSQVGLSHNVEGEGDIVNGVYVVREIISVNSVDLVDRPATTNGLFEGKMKKMKSWLREDGEMPVMTAEPDAAGGTDPDSMLAAGFKEVCKSLLDQIIDGEVDPKAGLKKLGAIIKTHFKLAGDDTGTEQDDDKKDGEEEDDDKDAKDGTEEDDTYDDDKKDGEEEDDDDKKDGKEEEDDDKKDGKEDDETDSPADTAKKGTERRKRESVEIAELRAELEVLRLCESVGVRLTEIQHKAAVSLPNKSDRKRFIESLKRKSDREPVHVPARSGGPAGGLTTGTPSRTYEDFIRNIKE